MTKKLLPSAVLVEGGEGGAHRPLENDFVWNDEFNRLLYAGFGHMAGVLLPGHAAHIRGGSANLGNYPPVLREHKLHFSRAINRRKLHPLLTRKDRMGRRVERAGFVWQRGKAVGR